MLATSAGYEFEVDRGPDWLWIGVRAALGGDWRTASLADEINEVIDKHFTYRVVLELTHLPKLSGNVVLSSKLIGELVDRRSLVRTRLPGHKRDRQQQREHATHAGRSGHLTTPSDPPRGTAGS